MGEIEKKVEGLIDYAKYGRLLVLGRSGKWTGRRPYLSCICDCGAKVEVLKQSLENGATQSCGCFNRELASLRLTKHGLSRHPAYRTWYGMVQRCEDPGHQAYKYYGGRGITVCDAWKVSPEEFIEWAESNGYGAGLELDRENNDSGYSPENCRFVTKEVNANNRRNNRTLLIGGERITVAQASRKFNLNYNTIGKRLSMGWVGERLVAPARAKTKSAVNA